MHIPGEIATTQIPDPFLCSSIAHCIVRLFIALLLAFYGQTLDCRSEPAALDKLDRFRSVAMDPREEGMLRMAPPALINGRMLSVIATVPKTLTSKVVLNEGINTAAPSH
jgi:hypothetical protein